MLEVRSPGCARAGEVIVPARGKDPEEASIVDDLERYEQHEQHDDDGERDARAAAPARWRPRRELRRHERGGEKFGCGSRRCKPRLLSRRGILVSLQVFRTRLVQHARLLDAAHLAWTRRAVELDLVIGTRHGRLLLVRGLVARTSRVKEGSLCPIGPWSLRAPCTLILKNLRTSPAPHGVCKPPRPTRTRTPPFGLRRCGSACGRCAASSLHHGGSSTLPLMRVTRSSRRAWLWRPVQARHTRPA